MDSVPAEFYDLTRRITNRFDSLATGDGRLYAVIGGPSSGKTTLLHYLVNKYKNQNPEIRPVVVPVFINFNETPLSSINSLDDALSWLFEELRSCLKRDYNLCALSDDIFKRFGQNKYDPADTFGEAFNFMRITAKDRLGEVRLVALIDNADALVASEIGRDLFNCWHALFKNPRVNGFFDLILAGGDGLYDRLNEPNATWRDEALILYLTNFGPAEVKAFLSAKTQNQLPAHVSLLIGAYSGGQPFLLQYFVNKLEVMHGGKWSAVTADMVLEVAESFLEDEKAQRRLDVWHIPDRDESSMTHQAYRLLVENCPLPETLANTLTAPSPNLANVLVLIGSEATDLSPLFPLLDRALAEISGSPVSSADWPARLALLRDKTPGLYYLLACPFGGLRSAHFRRTLGQTSSQGYSYKRALDRLLYLGAVQLSAQQDYFIQGQILLDHFQEFSPRGKFSLAASTKKRIDELKQGLSLLQEQTAQYGGEVYAPLPLRNQIESIKKELGEAQTLLDKLDKE